MGIPGKELLIYRYRKAAITNMGAELGATTSIFPGELTRLFMKAQGGEKDWIHWADPDANMTVY